MGEITSLIEDVQKDKDQFAKLEQAMEPLINKYMRKLYKDDKDDVYAELILALWEAVTKLKYVENDGQCLRFLEKALQNKFYELYRSSCIFRKNRALAPHERSAVPLGTDHCPVG